MVSKNVETIKKDALIAKARKQNASAKKQRREQDKLSQRQTRRADLEIAQKQNELKLKQAALKQEADIALPRQMLRKGLRQKCNVVNKSVAAEANIMKQEKEAEVKETRS